MQVGFSVDAWKQRFPKTKVIQLAVDGSNPLPALLDLAEDRSFRGTVVCDVEAWSLLTKETHGPQNEYVSYFHHNWGPSKEAECLLRSIIERSFVIANPRFAFPEIVRYVSSGRWAGPQYIQMRWDRSVLADYTMVDISWHRERWLRLTRQAAAALQDAAPEDWLKDVRDVREQVRRIQERGGNVVFVRFPTSGELRKLEEQHFPKAQYWDSFAKLVGAETIHFEEVPALSGFNCPEGSHLDERDAPKFTMALADELLRRGVLQRPPASVQEQASRTQ
jgi:hypothetical protein